VFLLAKMRWSHYPSSLLQVEWRYYWFFLSPSQHQDWVLFLLNSGNGTETQDEVFVNLFIHLSTPTIRSWWNQWGRRSFDTHKKLKLACILLCLRFWWFGWKLTQIGFLQSVIIEFYHALGQRAQQIYIFSYIRKMSQVQPGQGEPGISRWECLKKKMTKINQNKKIVSPFWPLLP
jgi:hypothetical protein